ncbi:MAG: PEP-CTERM sorting domain-containing protein [Isosphaeraceae bacterium]
MLWLVCGNARADLTINTPVGLVAGDTFRIVFVTDAVTTATSSDIGYYNTFVTNDASAEAGGGVVTYNGVNLTWTAIASTPSINAIDNVTGSLSAPIYLSNGSEVASSYTTNTGGLWSGQLSTPISLDLTGGAPVTDVWTGTAPNGQGLTGYQLGLDTSEFGFSGLSRSSWTALGTDLSSIAEFSVYGISQVLMVPGTVSVPEPSTLWMAAGGICAGVAFRWNRRRRQQRR